MTSNLSGRQALLLAFLGLASLPQPAWLPAAEPSRAGKFVHPGLLHDAAELEFIKARVREGAEPWKSGWRALVEHPVSRMDWKPRAIPHVVRGTNNAPDLGASDLEKDGAAAYSQAIQWSLTGGEAHAAKAIAILKAYADTLESVTGHDAQLLVGMAGISFLNAAELLRGGDSGWGAEDRGRFEHLLRDVFLPVIRDFHPTANGNWDAAMLQTILGLAVYLDDRVLFDRAVDYALNGRSNGAIPLYLNAFGECQESGRDQSHTQMGLGYLGCACEIAWKQGVDLYGASGNRLALGYEYTAKYNLGSDVPYEPYRSLDGRYKYPRISPVGRGRFRAIYERVYHHYHDRAGLEMPFTKQVIDRIRPEGWNIQHVSWNTLMCAQLPPPPKGHDPKHPDDEGRSARTPR